MAMMLGFILSIVAGLILIPLFKRIRAGQNVSTTIGERHMKKNGTPTLGGFIFIIPTIVTLLLLIILTLFLKIKIVNFGLMCYFKKIVATVKLLLFYYYSSVISVVGSSALLSTGESITSSASSGSF